MGKQLLYLVQRTSSCRLPEQRWHWVHSCENLDSRLFKWFTWIWCKERSHSLATSCQDHALLQIPVKEDGTIFRACGSSDQAVSKKCKVVGTFNKKHSMCHFLLEAVCVQFLTNFECYARTRHTFLGTTSFVLQATVGSIRPGYFTCFQLCANKCGYIIATMQWPLLWTHNRT